ncbi:MAG: GTP-binding protein [Thermoguttaceae bacterium]
MMKTKLILVGGFLGSGKTTLLWTVARILAEQGESVGLITNDQAPDLVDSALLTRTGAGIQEVAGSCFCCHFNGFKSAIDHLILQGATTIIAEPVGSCTDLAATIMQPLKKFCPEINLAPLSVLVDPNRLDEVFGQKTSQIDQDALYIMQLQMKESDLLVVNKIDTLSEERKQQVLELLQREIPGKPIVVISATQGIGVESWIDGIQTQMKTGVNVGSHIVPVDYDRYAKGEAVLGWLNAAIFLTDKTGGMVDPGHYLQHLLATLHKELIARNAEIGHLKAIISLNGRSYIGNLTQLSGSVSVRELVETGNDSTLTINARVQMSPDDLELLVRKTLETVDSAQMGIDIQTLHSLMPGRPNPTFRFQEP